MTPTTPPLQYTEAYLTPEDTIRAANEIAARTSPDAAMRALTSAIAPRDMKHAFVDIPRSVAVWVRANIRYMQESPGIETLQGPYTTLPAALSVGDFRFSGTGVGDCDDLAILWATLCRAAGVPAYVAGIAPYPYDGLGFMHAVGCVMLPEAGRVSGPSTVRFYELSKDEWYGGIPNKPIEFYAPPLGTFAVIYEPTYRRFVGMINDPDNPLPSYDASAGFYAKAS